jgi:hypothetical protein
MASFAQARVPREARHLPGHHHETESHRAKNQGDSKEDRDRQEGTPGVSHDDTGYEGRHQKYDQTEQKQTATRKGHRRRSGVRILGHHHSLSQYLPRVEVLPSKCKGARS